MKRLFSHSPRYESGPNMTPLVDVVMVILIFLMLAGSFASGEHFLQTKVPAVSGPGRGTAQLDPGLRFDVYVSAPTSADFVARANGIGRVTDVETLAVRLAEQRARYAAAGTPPESVIVVIHPAPGAKWGPVAGTYDAALRAEFKKVTFAWARQ